MTTATDAPELALTTLRILRRPEIRTITGFCDEQIDKMEAREQFPRRIHTGARTCGWIEHEVRQWLLERMAERDDAARTEAQRVARMPPAVRARYRREREGAEPPDA